MFSFFTKCRKENNRLPVMLFDVVFHLIVFSASLAPKMRDFTHAFKVEVFSSVDDSTIGLILVLKPDVVLFRFILT